MNECASGIQPLSEAEEAELRKIVEGMMAGPWSVDADNRQDGADQIIAPNGVDTIAFMASQESDDDFRAFDNAMGIVALRNNAERMLATIAELRQQVNTLTTAAEQRRVIFDEALEHLKQEPVHLVLFTANIKLRERIAAILALLRGKRTKGGEVITSATHAAEVIERDILGAEEK